MRFRFQPWQLAALLIVICAGLIAGVYIYRASGDYAAADLASYLPLSDGALVYLDVAALRGAGILDLIAGKKAAADLEYRSFLDQTRFDYRDDLDTVVALFHNDEVFMVVRGRFDWKSLTAYAKRHAGSCSNGYCTTQGSKPERRISFYPIRSDLMALAVSRDPWAAFNISKHTGRLPITPPYQPVWAVLSGPILKNLTAIPDATKAFAQTLENADQLVFTMGEEGPDMELGVNVTCRDADKAELLRGDLEETTNRLRSRLEKDHLQLGRDDLRGILTAGVFRRADRQVFGVWPLRRSFVEAVAGGTYQQ